MSPVFQTNQGVVFGPKYYVNTPNSDMQIKYHDTQSKFGVGALWNINSSSIFKQRVKLIANYDLIKKNRTTKHYVLYKTGYSNIAITDKAFGELVYEAKYYYSDMLQFNASYTFEVASNYIGHYGIFNISLTF